MPVAILQPLSSPVGDVVIYTGPLQPIGQLHRVTPGSRQFIDAPQKSFLRGVGVELEAMSEQVQQGASRKTEQRSLDVAQVAPHPIVAPAMASFGARARPRAYPLPRQVSRLSVADSHTASLPVSLLPIHRLCSAKVL